MRDAYVGRIDVAIDVEKAGIAVTLLADGIRKPANGEKVRRAIERDAVLEAQALACENLVRNRLQPLVGDSKFAHCASSTDFSLCSPVNKKTNPHRLKPVLLVRDGYSRAPEQQEQETNITVHREKRSIHPAEIVWRNQ